MVPRAMTVTVMRDSRLLAPVLPSKNAPIFAKKDPKKIPGPIHGPVRSAAAAARPSGGQIGVTFWGVAAKVRDHAAVSAYRKARPKLMSTRLQRRPQIGRLFMRLDERSRKKSRQR